MALRILIAQPGIKAMPPCNGNVDSTTGPAGNSFEFPNILDWGCFPPTLFTLFVG